MESCPNRKTETHPRMVFPCLPSRKERKEVRKAAGPSEIVSSMLEVGWPGLERWTLILYTIRTQLQHVEESWREQRNRPDRRGGVTRAWPREPVSEAKPEGQETAEGSVGYARGWSLLN